MKGRFEDKSWQPKSEQCFERELIFAIGLRARVEAIREEFRGVDLETEEYCDNGVSAMANNGTVERSKRVVQLACNRWRHDDAGLKSAIESMDLLKECVKRNLRLSEDELRSLDGTQLRKLILKL